MRPAAPSRSSAVAATTMASNCAAFSRRVGMLPRSSPNPRSGRSAGELRPPAHRAGADAGAGRQVDERAADERVAGVAALGEGGEHEAGGRPGGQVLGRVHGDVGAPVEDVLLHLLHEHAGAAHRVDRHVALLVTAGRDDHELGVAAEALGDARRLEAGERAAARRDPQRGHRGSAFVVGRAPAEAEHLVEVEELRQRVGVELAAHRPRGAFTPTVGSCSSLLTSPRVRASTVSRAAGSSPREAGTEPLELRLPQLLRPPAQRRDQRCDLAGGPLVAEAVELLGDDLADPADLLAPVLERVLGERLEVVDVEQRDAEDLPRRRGRRCAARRRRR